MDDIRKVYEFLTSIIDSEVAVGPIHAMALLHQANVSDDKSIKDVLDSYQKLSVEDENTVLMMVSNWINVRYL